MEIDRLEDDKLQIEAIDLGDIDVLEEDITPVCCCGAGCGCKS